MIWSRFAGRTIYLDANVFIYALEGVAPYADTLRDLLASVDSGKIHAVSSELTIAEVLARPFRTGASEQVEQYGRVFAGGIAVRMGPISRAILELAARVRGEGGLKLADAIHAATALATGCQSLLSNDRDFVAKCPAQVESILLMDVL